MTNKSDWPKKEISESCQYISPWGMITSTSERINLKDIWLKDSIRKFYVYNDTVDCLCALGCASSLQFPPLFFPSFTVTNSFVKILKIFEYSILGPRHYVPAVEQSPRQTIRYITFLILISVYADFVTLSCWSGVYHVETLYCTGIGQPEKPTCPGKW